MLNTQFVGILFAVLSAACYGLNPLGGLILYQEGFNPTSVLFYRFLFATIIFALLILFTKQSFRISFYEFKVLAILGFLFFISSIMFFASFKLIDAGISATLLFIYPVLVALLMAIFFKEKLSVRFFIAIIFIFIGMMFLYSTQKGNLNLAGLITVFISALSYACYIVIVNKSKIMMSSLKLSFYSIGMCLIFLYLFSLIGKDNQIYPIVNLRILTSALFLSIVPTVISLITLVKAIHIIGSTKTSIIGALEPVTAVAVGVLLFNEPLNLPIVLSIIFICTGVLFVIHKGNKKHRFSINMSFNRIKKWRWRS